MLQTNISRDITYATSARTRPGRALIRVDVHGHAVVFQHAHDRFGQLHVEPIGIQVDKEKHLASTAARRACEPSPMGLPQKTAHRQVRHFAALRQSDETLQQPAQRCSRMCHEQHPVQRR